LANANAQTMMDAYGKGLAAQQGALSMAPQTMGMGLQPMDIMGQVGAYNTGIDTQALDADRQRWDYNQNLPWENLGRYSNIVSQAPWGSSTTADGGGSSPLAGALGGGLLGASLAGPVGSLAASAGLGLSGGAMGPSAALATGAANPFMLPLVIGGGLLGAFR
ncbi:MAG: hypothetical protein KJN90_06515, partial [Gammaproteobacteria bacterium]|nr:hypothetical protein [Gammaproteobacteria bacterium]